MGAHRAQTEPAERPARAPEAAGGGGGAAPARRSLVTGGAGFIGSHLVEALLARGDSVTVVDDLSTGRRENLPGGGPGGRGAPGLTFVHARLGEALADGRVRPRGFDEVYHLAAAVGVRLIVDEPIASIDNNIRETSELLRAAAGTDEGPARGGDGPRVLIASSSEVYGKGERTPFREDDDVLYGPTSKSRWSYACSKAIDEYLALAYCQRDGLPVVVVRLFNTVGPRQVGRYGMVLPRFVAAALEGADLPVHGDGRQTRCFCDVRDVAPALARLLGCPAAAGRVFNLGSDRPISVADLAATVVRVLGSSSRARLVPYDTAYASGFEDLRRREPDLTRVREAIGWKPTIELERTITDLASWMRGTAPAPSVLLPEQAKGPTGVRA